MEYSIKDLIGMLNLAVIIANGKNEKNVQIPKDAAIELTVYLQDALVALGQDEEDA